VHVHSPFQALRYASLGFPSMTNDEGYPTESAHVFPSLLLADGLLRIRSDTLTRVHAFHAPCAALRGRASARILDSWDAVV
jgi:hypothetical protein